MTADRPRLFLLGRPRCELPDGGEFPLGKPFALLAYLACRGEAVRRDELAELFWPDSPPDRQRASLRQAAWFVRKHLGEDVLSGEDALEVHPDALRIDVVELRRNLEKGDVDEALALHRGPFLERFTVPASREWNLWVDETRLALEREVAAAFLRRGQERLAAGEFAGAEADGRRVAELEPQSRSGHRLLIEGAICRGRTERAWTALQRARELSVGEGDGSDWDELEARLEATVRIPLPEGEEEGLRLEFVGRTEELADLVQQWRLASEVASRACVVTGPAGVGKTRLLGELGRVVEGGGMQYVRVKAYPAERVIPCSFVGEVMRALLVLPGAAGASGATRAVAEALVPSSASGEGRRAPPTMPPLTAIADALLDLVSAVAWESPLCLAVDDLQWVDRDSAAVLGRVLRAIGEPGVLFVLASRLNPSMTHALLDETLDEVQAARLALSSLTRGEVAELVALMVAEEDAPLFADDLADTLYGVTGGSPLFLLEVIRRLDERGAVGRDQGQIRVLTGDAVAIAREHSDLRALFARRAEGLRGDALEIARALARAGTPQRPARLSDRLGLDEPRAREGVQDLLASGIVRPTADGRIDFVHDEMRDVVAAMSDAGGWKRPVAVAVAAVLAAALGWGIWSSAGAFDPASSYFGGGELIIRTDDGFWRAALPPERDDPFHWERVDVPGTARGPVLPVRLDDRWTFVESVTPDPDAGPDIALLLLDGTRETIAATPGDDIFRGATFDGRWIYYSTEDGELPYDPVLWRLDRSSGERRLIARPGHWWGSASSPDGQRIAIAKYGRPDTLEVLTPLGETAGTFMLSDVEEADLLATGWCRSRGPLLMRVRRGVVPELALFDPESGGFSFPAPDLPFGGYAVCLRGGEVIVAGMAIDGVFRLIAVDLADGTRRVIETPGEPTWAQWQPVPPVSYPVALDVPRDSASVAWGQEARLSPRLVMQDGTTAAADSVAWRSRDPMVVGVEDDVVTGNAPGGAWVVAEANGWMRDSVYVAVEGDGGEQLLLFDSLTHVDPARWAIFALPAPDTVVDGGRSVASLRGDGINGDWILSRETLDVRQGVTLELDVRTRITRSDRQAISVCMEDYPTVERAELSSVLQNGVCYRYPRGTLTRMDPSEAALATRAPPLQGPVELPEGLDLSEWHTVQLQLRPDGHVSVFVNGAFLGSLPWKENLRPGARLRVAIAGFALDTFLHVRNLRVWRGTRGLSPEGEAD